MPRVWSFHLPTRIEFGRGVFRRLGQRAAAIGERALLVGYRQPGPLATVYERAAAALRQSGVKVDLLLVAEPEPTVDHLSAAATQATPLGADLVVGLGGGSVLDLAKGLAACLGAGPRVLAALAAPGELPQVTEALPVLAVPTTAGTGAEVTSVAVFTEPADPPLVTVHRDGRDSRGGRRENGTVPLGPEGDRHIFQPEARRKMSQSPARERLPPLKRTLVGPALLPRVALVDPELSAGSPPELVARCAADALGHALETACSRSAHPLTSMLSANAASLIVRNLPRAIASPQDGEAREALALAALLAGAALNDAGVVVGHVLAHGLGAVLRVPHGLAVAASILPTLRYNAPACRDAYAALASACGLGGVSPDQQAQRLMDAVAGLLQAAGLPARLPVAEGLSQGLLDRLVESGTASTPIGLTLNPRKVQPHDLRDLFAQCLEGA